MKKFFTLIAAVALAASVNAQGTYAVQVGDKVNAGDRITSVKKCHFDLYGECWYCFCRR